MSDAQLLFLLRMILSKLSNGVNKLENELPQEYKVVSGGSHIFLDPKRVSYPIINPLYELKEDLIVGIDELEIAIAKEVKHA